jgi:hypothetical protein
MKIVRRVVQGWLACGIVFACAWCAEVKYLPDRLGRVFIEQRADNPQRYRLTPGELQAYRQKLRRIAEWVAAQPALSPARGFNLNGWGQIVRAEDCPVSGPCANTPVAAWFSLPLAAWTMNLSTGKEYTQEETGEFVNLHINNAVGIYNRYELEKFPSGETKAEDLPLTVDEARHRFLSEPRHITDADGCPVYEAANGDRQFLLVTRIRRPLFVPVTREALLRSIIREWKKRLAESEGMLAQMKMGPAAELYRKWMAERDQRVATRQQAYAFAKRSNPEKAEAMLRQMVASDEQVTANLRREMEKEQQARERGGGTDARTAKAEKDVGWMRDVLARLERKLAGEAPGWLAAQARYLPATFWESVDSPEGKPLVMINPRFTDPKLSPSEIQYIVATFRYSREIESGKPVHEGSAPAAQATHLGVWRMKQDSRWSALKGIMPEPRP